jgi:two-component system, chemotaxis family, protein-glutamate methylesterase/glutaminase
LIIQKNKYSAIVIGASAGGIASIKALLQPLPHNFPAPIIIVQHVFQGIDPRLHRDWLNYYNSQLNLKVKEAEVYEPILPSTVYFAPPGYHLVVEPDKSFSINVDERVNYSRPSIDVLFETAADVFGKKLVGIILSGNNIDGAQGLLRIKQVGGLTIVQNPEETEFSVMPQNAMLITNPHYVLNISEITRILVQTFKH